jgi:hypothetical protein
MTPVDGYVEGECTADSSALTARRRFAWKASRGKEVAMPGDLGVAGAAVVDGASSAALQAASDT